MTATRPNDPISNSTSNPNYHKNFNKKPLDIRTGKDADKNIDERYTIPRRIYVDYLSVTSDGQFYFQNKTTKKIETHKCGNSYRYVMKFTDENKNLMPITMPLIDKCDPNHESYDPIFEQEFDVINSFKNSGYDHLKNCMGLFQFNNIEREKVRNAQADINVDTDQADINVDADNDADNDKSKRRNNKRKRKNKISNNSKKKRQRTEGDPVDYLNDQIDALNKIVVDLNRKKDEVEACLNKTISEKSELLKKIDLNEQEKLLSNFISEMNLNTEKDKVNILSMEIVKLRNIIDNNQDNIDLLEIDNDLLEIDNVQLKKQLDNFDLKFKELENSFREKLDLYSSFHTSVVKLKSTVFSIQSEFGKKFDKQNKNINKIQEEKNQLQAKIAKIQGNLNKSSRINSKLLRELKENELKIESEKEKTKSLSCQVSSLNLDLKLKDENNRKYVDKITDNYQFDLNHKMAIWKEQITISENKLNELKSVLNEKEAIITELKKQAQIDRDKHESEKLQLYKSNKSLKNQLDDSLKELKQNKLEHDSNIQKTINTLNGLEKEKADLEKLNDALCADLDGTIKFNTQIQLQFTTNIQMMENEKVILRTERDNALKNAATLQEMLERERYQFNTDMQAMKNQLEQLTREHNKQSGFNNNSQQSAPQPLVQESISTFNDMNQQTITIAPNQSTSFSQQPIPRQNNVDQQVFFIPNFSPPPTQPVQRTNTRQNQILSTLLIHQAIPDQQRQVDIQNRNKINYVLPIISSTTDFDALNNYIVNFNASSFLLPDYFKIANDDQTLRKLAGCLYIALKNKNMANQKELINAYSRYKDSAYSYQSWAKLLSLPLKSTYHHLNAEWFQDKWIRSVMDKIKQELDYSSFKYDLPYLADLVCVNNNTNNNTYQNTNQINNLKITPNVSEQKLFRAPRVPNTNTPIEVINLTEDNSSNNNSINTNNNSKNLSSDRTEISDLNTNWLNNSPFLLSNNDLNPISSPPDLESTTLDFDSTYGEFNFYI